MVLRQLRSPAFGAFFFISYDFLPARAAELSTRALVLSARTEYWQVAMVLIGVLLAIIVDTYTQ
eukprot:3366972-Rhodomonas_salina.1